MQGEGECASRDVEEHALRAMEAMEAMQTHWELVRRLLASLCAPLLRVIQMPAMDGFRLTAFVDTLGTLLEMCALAAADGTLRSSLSAPVSTSGTAPVSTSGSAPVLASGSGACTGSRVDVVSGREDLSATGADAPAEIQAPGADSETPHATLLTALRTCLTCMLSPPKGPDEVCRFFHFTPRKFILKCLILKNV